jgi:6-phosphogluconolactonase
MSFLRAARAALTGNTRRSQIVIHRTMTRSINRTIAVVALAVFSLSCGSSSHSTSGGGPNHNAYVTLPNRGSVLLLHINGSNGVITAGSETPQVQNTSPTGLALLPSKKFLYVMNSSSFADSISIFAVASDGTLTLSAPPTPVGFGPNNAVIDPSGKYLLVTNNFGSDVSVFSIDNGSGALTEVAGSPFPANSHPTEILINPTGQFVYVTNPGLGAVTAFSFSSADGTLTQLATYSSLQGGGALGLALDGSGRFLYVANPSGANPLQSNTGNISAFNVDPTTGALSPILGSPFSATVGSSPSSVSVDPSGRFLYATTPGSSFSIWCFAIDPSSGRLKLVTGSPFSLAAGGLFSLFDPAGNYFYIGSAQPTGVNGYTFNPSTGLPTVISGSPFASISAPGKMVLSE